MKTMLLRFLPCVLLIAMVTVGFPVTADANSGPDPIKVYSTDDERVSAHLKFVERLNRKHHKFMRFMNPAGFELQSSNGLEGDPSSVTLYQAGDDDWIPSERYMISYDNELVSEELIQLYNNQSETWVNDSRGLFTHSNQQLLTSTEQVYMSGNWINEYEYEFSYETIGGQSFLKSVVEFIWNGNIQEWERETLSEVTYNNGVISKIESFGWLGSGWSEQPSFVIEVEQEGNDIYETYFDDWNGSDWGYIERIIYVDTTPEEYYNLAIRLDYFVMLGGMSLMLEQLNLGDIIYQYFMNGEWVNEEKIDVQLVYDNSGTMLQEKIWVSSFYDEFEESWFTDSRNSIFLNEEGKFTGGSFSVYEGEGEDEGEEFWLPIFVETYTLNDQDLISEVIVEFDFGDFFVPFTRSTIDYTNDPTSAEPVSQLPVQVELLQNYPNPFNPTTIIPYRLNEPANVRLEVFNMMGQRVALLADESLQAGTYSVNFDATGLASGVYFYRLNAGNSNQSKKMLLVK